MDDNYISKELARFNITDSAITELNERYKGLKVISLEDTDGYKAVRAARLEVKGYRVDVEKRRKELTEDSLKFKRAVDNEAKRITNLLLPLETQLEEQEKFIDNEKEKIKREEEEKKAAIEAERIKQRTIDIIAIGFRFNGVIYDCDYNDKVFTTQEIKLIPAEQFYPLMEKLSAAYQTYLQVKLEQEKRLQEIKVREEAELKAERERLAEQRKQQEEENRKLEAAREEQRKKEQALIKEAERINAEKQRLAEKEYIKDSKVPANAFDDEDENKKYSVEMCGTFKRHETVTAKNEKEAKEFALDRLYQMGDFHQIYFEHTDIEVMDL